jgi:hypothetical protein
MINKPTRKSIFCKDCSNHVRIWQEGPATTTRQDRQFRHCPLCGGTNLTERIDLEVDYWEVLGEHYGLPASVVKQIYDAWEPTECRNFGDFIAQLRAENEVAKSVAT